MFILNFIKSCICSSKVCKYILFISQRLQSRNTCVLKEIKWRILVSHLLLKVCCFTNSSYIHSLAESLTANRDISYNQKIIE